MIKCNTGLDGTKIWTNSKGQFHRTKGPAIECFDGSKYWYQYGKPHRLDGPAIERANGSKVWRYQGKYINCHSQQEFEKLLKLKSFW